MLRPLLVVPLVVAALAGGWLARAALLRWRDLRAAQTYELAAEQRPMLLRAGGAVVCGMCVTALAVVVALGARPAASVADETPVAATPRPAAPPASSAATPELPPVVTHFESVGHPAGGDLAEAVVAAPDGRPRKVRVWVPAEYKADPKAVFPVIVLHSGTAGRTADAELPDVFEGVSSAVKLGKAKPFVVVAPEAPNGTGHPCDLLAAAPQAVADDAALRAAVTGAFRTAPAGPGGWGVLGVEGGAPCAAAAGLTRPDLYGAAAAVSGRYDAPALATAGAESAGNASTRLLLAAAKGDAPGLAAARKLQSTLRGGKGRAAGADVRISDIVEDFAPDRERMRLVRVAVQYLAEMLAKQA
ncbi:hypothetical protein AB0K43_20745 [Kitasatospora sp. NPDC049258]|uniref:hypothetical protein n=1 Tax=Kitasatospora sp. NPDC049258 TaxID=3155394 RepID=UPI0034309B39